MTADKLVRKGERLEAAGDLAGAERLYRQADEAGSAQGAACLGVLLFERGDVGGARDALARSDERGSGLGSFRLGFLLEHLREYAAAEQAYHRAVARGNEDAADNLAAMARFRRTRDQRDPMALLKAGVAYAAAGDTEQAVSAYYATIDTAHPDHAANAWFNLGALHQQSGDIGPALAAYRTVMAAGHPEFGPRAAVNVGFVLFNARNDVAGAREAFQVAIASGHPVQAPLARRNLAAMTAIQSSGDTLDVADDTVNVADGRGPGRLKFRFWRPRR
nr:tetratricopeptide repeat protein [Micromonospora sp. DSM 115978]